MNWDSGTGKFDCGSDSSGGGSFSGLEIFNSGGTPGLRYGSISFDASDFTVTFSDTASTAFVKLDYANGPASRSIEQTILSQWEFRNGASFSADLEIYDNSGPAFAIFSSTSLGRFGLGDVTPEAYFEIASDSGVTASISNIFFVNAGVGASVSPKFEVYNTTATASIEIVSGNNSDKRFTILSNYTGYGINDRLSILNSSNVELFSISSTGLTDVDTLRTGPISFEDDAGIVSWVNMEITSASTGTVMSYTAQIDSQPVLTIYGTTGPGNTVANLNVGVGTVTPLSKFTIVDTGTGGIASGSFSVRSSNTVGSVASVSAASLTTGNVFKILTPASTSFTGRLFSAKDVNNKNIFAVYSSGSALFRESINVAIGDSSTVSYSRFGTATVNGPESNWISTNDDLLLSSDLYLVGSISANIASASLYKGLAFNSVGDCNDSGEALGWDLGIFFCLAVSSGGGGFNGIEVLDSGETTSNHFGSISFDAGMFTVSDNSPTASSAYIRLDWTTGPASRSANESITGFWEFQSGASFSNDVEFYDRSNNSMFAIFSSTSLGRFGLGDTTPETFFEIASSSGITASISNIFSINADSSLLSITGKASISNSLEITRNGTTGSHLKLTDSSISPEHLNYFTLSVNDGDFQIQIGRAHV